MQEAWCYVSDNCTSAALRGSFGRRYESCDATPEWESEAAMTGREPARLVPVSGCNCSGTANAHGFGAYWDAWRL